MKNKGAVENHFDKASGIYQLLITYTPVAWIKKREIESIRRYIGDVSGKAVVDFGCGIGTYTEMLLDAGADHVYAVDLSEQMIKQFSDNPSITGVVSDAKDFRPDQQFSRIVCAGMLEFVDSPAEIMRKVYEWAQPGAILVILVPYNGFFGWLYYFYHRIHQVKVWVFSRSSIEEDVKLSGWQVEAHSVVWPIARVLRLRKPGS